MKKCLIVLVVLLLVGTPHGRGQVGGNVGYSQTGGRARAEQAERAKRVLTKEELPPTGTSMFVEANVLMNVRADEFVAVFAVSQEAETVAECNRKMDATLKELAGALQPLGLG